MHCLNMNLLVTEPTLLTSISERVLVNLSVLFFIELIDLVLRSEDLIIPESDLSFDSTVALEKQLRSLLCACFPSTLVMPKYCVILSDIIKSSLLTT